MFGDRVSWGEELRRFDEYRVRQRLAEESLERIIASLRNASWSLERGEAVEIVREDRDSR